MKTIIQTIVIYVGIATSGWFFHDYVSGDIEKRIGRIPVYYSVDSGRSLENQIQGLERRVNERLAVIETDVKKILQMTHARNEYEKLYGVQKTLNSTVIR